MRKIPEEANQKNDIRLRALTVELQELIARIQGADG